MNLKKLTMLFALALALLASGCAGRRPARSQGELMQLRKAHDELFAKMSRDAVQQLMQTVKARYDRHPNDRRPKAPRVASPLRRLVSSGQIALERSLIGLGVAYARAVDGPIGPCICNPAQCRDC